MRSTLLCRFTEDPMQRHRPERVNRWASSPRSEWNPKCLCGDWTVRVSAWGRDLPRKGRTRAARAARPRWAPTIATAWHTSPTPTYQTWGTGGMSSTSRTRTMAPCPNSTRWIAATSSCGRRSTTTLRSQRQGCPTRGFRPTTGCLITRRWSRTAIGRTVLLRWATWGPKGRRVTVLTDTRRRRQRCTRLASCRRRLRRRVGCRAVHRLNRRSKCLTICTLNSIWSTKEFRLISSTSCTRWTTCSIRRRCHLCISSRCMASSRHRSSPHKTPTPRYLARSTLGCGVNSVSWKFCSSFFCRAK